MSVKKALIAMSGGVDSSVAAWLAKEDGLACTGVSMELFSGKNNNSPLRDVDNARSVAEQLGIPFFVYNLADRFEEFVVRRFVEAYQSGTTPNPCIDCNYHLKFGCLLQRARDLEQDYLVTGHYAQIEKAANGRYLLKKGLDRSKDQSYVLYTLNQDQLARTLFPLGTLHKTQVRDLARREGFANAQKPDSQDICFIPDGDHATFIETYTGVPLTKGRFVDHQGTTLGEHGGIARYTIGQRKGLGLAVGKPIYICAIDAEANTVVLGDTQDLYSKTLRATRINLIPFDRLQGTLKVKAKLRYKQQEQPATVRQLDGQTLHVEFDQPQRAITKGQAVVLYSDDLVVGGGTIC